MVILWWWYNLGDRECWGDDEGDGDGGDGDGYGGADDGDGGDDWKVQLSV